MIAYGVLITIKDLKYGHDLGSKDNGQTYVKSVKICLAARNTNSSFIFMEGVHV